MAPVDLPFLNLIRARGKLYPYYRRAGRNIRIHADPADQVALTAAWRDVHEAHEAADRNAAAAREARAVRPRSIRDLVARYRASPEWAAKAPATRTDYEKGLRPLETDFGNLPADAMLRRHVTAIRDRYAWRTEKDADGKERRVANGRQANRVVTVLSILLSYSVDALGWRPDNPALRPRRLRTDGTGFRPWSREEFRQFWDRSNEEWRFAALLALLTAQRGQDQVAMTWADYDGEAIMVVPQKRRGAVRLRVPCHDMLREALDARKAALAEQATPAFMLLARPDGRPWDVNAFQKAAGQAIRAAGLTGVVWHGLRGTAASWAAEGGASEKALMALLGHATTQMASKYSRGADQRRLAEAAVGAIVVPIQGAANVPGTQGAKQGMQNTARKRNKRP